MELNITDLLCTPTSTDAFRCTVESDAVPGWFYPMVVGCFVIALLVLLLVLRLVLIRGRKYGRRQDDREE